MAYAQESSTTTALTAPTLTAESTDGGSELSWEAVQGAVRYELWIYTNADGWGRIGGDNLTDTSYRHIGLARGSQSWNAVRAVDAQGTTGPWSGTASAIAGPRLPAPVLTAALTEGVINLEWTAVTGAVSYRLWAFDVEWELLVDEQDVTSHSHSGATAGTEYWYTVQAIDSIGLGGLFSEQVSATVPISGTATPTATVDGGRH